MIDETNVAIRELEDRVRQANAHRRAFYRVLRTTDRLLWRLEEMNRDGVRFIPEPLRQTIRDQVRELPASCAGLFQDSDRVQEVLDSIFDIQDCLFQLRDPEPPEEGGGELGRLAG